MKKVVCIDTWGYNNLQLGKVYKAQCAMGNDIRLIDGLQYPAIHFRLVDNFDCRVFNPQGLIPGELLHEPRQPAFWVVMNSMQTTGDTVQLKKPTDINVARTLRYEDFQLNKYFTCENEDIFTPEKIEIEVLY